MAAQHAGGIELNIGGNTCYFADSTTTIGYLFPHGGEGLEVEFRRGTTGFSFNPPLIRKIVSVDNDNYSFTVDGEPLDTVPHIITSYADTRPFLYALRTKYIKGDASANGGIYVFGKNQSESLIGHWAECWSSFPEVSSPKNVGDICEITNQMYGLANITDIVNSLDQIIWHQSINGANIAGEDMFVEKAIHTPLGISFELNFGLKERLLKIVLERAFKYEEAIAMVQASADRLIGFASEKIPDINADKVSTGFISPDYIPASCSAYFGDEVLSDFNITIKTKDSKNGFNSSLVSVIVVEARAVCSGANYLALKKIMEYERPSEDIIITLEEGYTIKFQKQGLTKIGNVTVDDDKREATVLLNGEYSLDYLSFNGVFPNITQINFNAFL